MQRFCAVLKVCIDLLSLFLVQRVEAAYVHMENRRRLRNRHLANNRLHRCTILLFHCWNFSCCVAFNPFHMSFVTQVFAWKNIRANRCWAVRTETVRASPKRPVAGGMFVYGCVHTTVGDGSGVVTLRGCKRSCLDESSCRRHRHF